MESRSVISVAGVHTTKLDLAMTTAVIETRPVDFAPIRKNVSKSTLDAELAVSLFRAGNLISTNFFQGKRTFP
jgi:hypothetical protein